MEPSSSWEAGSTSLVTLEIPNILWENMINYRVHNSPPLSSVMSQINAVHILILFV
jgi:hypothetical protein